MLILLIAGCAPASFLSPGFEKSGVAPARIDEGRGVRLRTVDGKQIRRRSILVEPGVHSLRFEVRRDLGSLDEERFQGIYQVGTCQTRVNAAAGRHYEVYTEIFFEDREKIYPNRPKGLKRETEVETMIGLVVHVRNVATGRTRRLSSETCVLHLDCKKVNPLYNRTGSECVF